MSTGGFRRRFRNLRIAILLALSAFVESLDWAQLRPIEASLGQRVQLALRLSEAPSAVPESGSVLDTMSFSLRLRWYGGCARSSMASPAQR